MKKKSIEEINNFLKVPTPKSWASEARGRIPELLNDHANCELKAASTAMGFIYKYSSFDNLCYKMSRIAREELRHFEQVKSLMKKRGISFDYIKPSRYAKTLRDSIRKNEPERFMDSLIVGAIIEARSCERFYYLMKILPGDISDFYARLVESESRHFLLYLEFARDHNNQHSLDFDNKLDQLLKIESDIITKFDSNFGFHSGPILQD
tara:strand:+ start:481 stop:1104 length:624 start_codon:yes stop_codon:yes gene_type:complete